jgi:hypothetical protein
MGCLPALIMLGLAPFIPESPRWLIFNDKHAEALSVFKRLHGDPERDPDYVLAREGTPGIDRSCRDLLLSSRALPSFQASRSRQDSALQLALHVHSLQEAHWCRHPRAIQ